MITTLALDAAAAGADRDARRAAGGSRGRRSGRVARVPTPGGTGYCGQQRHPHPTPPHPTTAARSRAAPAPWSCPRVRGRTLAPPTRHHGGHVPTPGAHRRRRPPRRRVRPARLPAVPGAARSEAAYLEAILAESVNDVPFRRSLDAARGFCAAHSRAMLDADRRRAGSLGAAILLRATLVARLRDLEAVARRRGWARARRTGEASRPPACPACRRVAEADSAVVEGLVRLTEDPRGRRRSPGRRCAWSISWRWSTGGRCPLVAARSRAGSWSGCASCVTASTGSPTPPRTTGGISRRRTRWPPWTRPRTCSRVPATGPGSVPDPAGRPRAAGHRRLRRRQVDGDRGARGPARRRGRPRRRDRPRLARLVRRAGRLGRARGSADDPAQPRRDARRLPRGRASGRSSSPAPRGRRAHVERLRSVLRMPLEVVRLEVDATVVRRALEGDPNGSRADDLEVALADLGAPAPDVGAWSGRRGPAAGGGRDGDPRSAGLDGRYMTPAGTSRRDDGAMPTDATIHPLVLQLRFTRREFLRGVRGVNDADGAVRLGPMNCIAWNVGHLAWQEQRYFVSIGQERTPYPEVAAAYEYGAPGSTPRLRDTLAAWKAITAEADPWLDTLTSELLAETPVRRGKPARHHVRQPAPADDLPLLVPHGREPGDPPDAGPRAGCRSSWATSTPRRRTSRSRGLSDVGSAPGDRRDDVDPRAGPDAASRPPARRRRTR